MGAADPLERQLRGGQRTGLRCRAGAVEGQCAAIGVDGGIKRDAARSGIELHIEHARRRIDRLIDEDAVDRVEPEGGAGTRGFGDLSADGNVAGFRALGNLAGCDLNVGACVEQAGNL